MKKIRLNQSKSAIVSDEDFEYLNQWKWGFDGNYARRRENGKKIYMHRVINNTPANMQTDHINRNKLDNRRENLRSTNGTTNVNNSNPRSTNRSGYKGVWFWKERNKWEASITVNYKKIYIGLFKEKESAIMARTEAEAYFLTQGRQYE